MAFGSPTNLPRYLRVEQEKVEKVAREYGLDFFTTIFEMLAYDQMNEIAAYGGFPNRYPHWRYGMEYERLSKSYEYGLSKIYEMVINNNPSYAYLLEGNSLTDQKLVMCHVYGHVDFFKNNFAFRVTDLDTSGHVAEAMHRRGGDYTPNRKWIDKMANHGGAIRRVVDRHGIAKVEEFIDHCLSIENLIDPWSRFFVRQREPPVEEDGPAAIVVPRLRAKDYMDDYINPEAYIEAERKKIEAEREQEKRFPAQPRQDVLLFLLENAPLERWERTVLGVIREEAYYFVPQMQTKIMNEGWACIAPDSLVLTDRGLVRMGRVVAGDAGCVADGETTRRIYDQNVIRDHAMVTVRTRRGLSLSGSDNHRVLLADGLTWKRLDELSIGERVAISGGQELWPAEHVPVGWVPRERLSRDHVLGHRTGLRTRNGDAVAAALVRYEDEDNPALAQSRCERRPVRLPAQVTPELGAFLGYLVGDGHISHAKRTLGLATGDESQALHFMRLARGLFDVLVQMQWEDSAPSGRWRVLFSSETVSDFLVEGLGLTSGPSANKKRIPEVVLRSPEPVVRRFISAYFDCDAYAGPCGVILDSASDELLEQLQLLLMNYGILSRVREQEDGTRQLHVEGASARRFHERIGFGLDRKRRALTAYLDANQSCNLERWDDEVVAVERGRGDVFDISVEETHRYVAQGFVNHNSYWHSRLMTERVADASEIVDYAENNAGVMATSGGRLNPYKLGVELYRSIEERWDKGRFGREWEECEDLDEKQHWDLRLGLGRSKIFEVRSLYNDVTFIDEFLTPEFALEHGLFTFGWSNRNERYEIMSREFKEVKEKLLFQLTNFGNPFIYVVDGNFENRGEMLLQHEHRGVDLRVDYARETLKALVRVWKRPVCIATTLEGKKALLRFDGTDYSTRHDAP